MFFILLLLNIFNLSNADWQRSDSPMENNFVDFMFQKGDTIVASYQLEIYIKIGDKPWELVESNYDMSEYIYVSNVFENDNKIYIVAINKNDPTGYLLYSKDFGLNWSPLYTYKFYFDFFNTQFTDKNVFIPIDTGLVRINKKTYVVDTIPKFFNENKSYFKSSKDLVFYTTSEYIDKSYKYYIHLSSDEGINFKKILTTEEEIKIIEYINEKIIIGTSSKIFTSDDKGESFKDYICYEKISGYDKLNYINGDYYLNYGESKLYQIKDFSKSWKNYFNYHDFEYIFGPFSINDEVIISTICRGASNKCFSNKNSNGTYIVKDDEIIKFDLKRNNHNHYFFKLNNDFYLLSGKSYFKLVNNNWTKDFEFDDGIFRNLIEYRLKYKKYENVEVIFSRRNFDLFFKNVLEDKWNLKEFNSNLKDFHKINNKFLLFTFSNSYFLSKDTLKTWKNINEINPNYNFNITYILNENNKLFAGTLNNGIISSEDGINWEKISNPNEIIFEEKINTFTKSDSVFIAFGDISQKLMKSENNGKDWIEVTNSPNITSVSHLKSFRNNFFMFANNGFYYSTDNGDNWTEHSVGLNKVKDPKYFAEKIKEVEIFDNKIFIIDSTHIFTLELEELGINLSVEKNEYSSNIKSYPQPATNEFVIEIDNLTKLVNLENIKLISVTGEEIDVQNLISIEKLNNKTLIRMKSIDIQNGVYFVKINQENIELNHKIIISN